MEVYFSSAGGFSCVVPSNSLGVSKVSWLMAWLPMRFRPLRAASL